MKELRTDIEIAASPERVWRELTDLASYPAWNPLLPAGSGELREGEQLRLTLKVGKRTLPIKVRLLRVAAPRELAWRGSLPVPGMFSGEHSFEIEPTAAGRVVFRHRERFTGLLVPLLTRVLDGETRRGFEAMNAALKARAERP